MQIKKLNNDVYCNVNEFIARNKRTRVKFYGIRLGWKRYPDNLRTD